MVRVKAGLASGASGPARLKQREALPTCARKPRPEGQRVRVGRRGSGERWGWNSMLSHERAHTQAGAPGALDIPGEGLGDGPIHDPAL